MVADNLKFVYVIVVNRILADFVLLLSGITIINYLNLGSFCIFIICSFQSVYLNIETEMLVNIKFNL